MLYDLGCKFRARHMDTKGNPMKPNIGSGDSGDTSVSRGRRVPKDSPQIEALGSIDEASAAIGLARAAVRSAEVKDLLRDCQLALQKCAAEIAAAGGPRATDFDFAAGAAALVAAMARSDEGAPRPSQFLTPGSSGSEAALQFARVAVRKAERRVITLRREIPDLPQGVAVYLNRLSDLLFDLAYAESSY
jgi:cob(I)alamin adenosyltransferase